jgi:hypothetical protein
MLRLMCALALVLVIVSPSLAEQSSVGTYKQVSFAVEVDGAPIRAGEKGSHGYVVITPTRIIAFSTSDNRKFGTSAADKAALLDTMSAWSGTYRIDGDKIAIAVDASWTELWNGKDQVRHWTLAGNRLTLTANTPYPLDPSKTSVARSVLEKIE